MNRALPSSITSSMTIWYAVCGSISLSGIRSLGTRSIPARVNRGTTVRSCPALSFFQTAMSPPTLAGPVTVPAGAGLVITRFG